MTKTSFEYQNNKSRSSSLYNTTSFYPLAALALAACGGGGGGGGNGGDDPTANAPVLSVGGEQTLTLEEGTTNPAAATGFSFTATDEDNDGVTLSVSDTSRFSIDVDGNLNILAGSEFDFETEPSITLTITATDDSTEALTDTQDVTIEVTDVAEAPVLTASGSQTLTLEEGTTNPAAATGFSFTATDEDDGDTVTLSVDDDRFEIIGGVLNVKANQTFDFETEPSITLTITATDDSTGLLTDTQEVTITVTNVDGDPELEVTTGTLNALNEGTVAADAAAADRETGYTIASTTTGATLSVEDDRFEIASDGKLLVKTGQVFDFETENPLTVFVRATASGLATRESVTITITDVAEAPVISVTGTQGTLNEGTVAAETATGHTITATDGDGDNVEFTFSDARFNIVNNELVIVASSVFDFETESSIALTITATDNSAGTLSSMADVIITITDVASAPVLTPSGTQNALPEGRVFVETATGYSFAATDEDGDSVLMMTALALTPTAH